MRWSNGAGVRDFLLEGSLVGDRRGSRTRSTRLGYFLALLPRKSRHF
jgi:hypothetical protein